MTQDIRAAIEAAIAEEGRVGEAEHDAAGNFTGHQTRHD